MIKLITFVILLIGSPERDSIGCGKVEIPTYLQEYFQQAKDNTKEPDLNDIFMIVTPEEKGKGVYRIMGNDTTQFETPLIGYHLETKGYYFVLDHANIDKSKVRSSYFGKEKKSSVSPKLSVRTLPKTFLSKVKVVDLNKRFEEIKGSNEKMLKFKDEFVGKRIWMIDRTFMTDESIRLVEMSFGIVNI